MVNPWQGLYRQIWFFTLIYATLPRSVRQFSFSADIIRYHLPKGRLMFRPLFFTLLLCVPHQTQAAMIFAKKTWTIHSKDFLKSHKPFLQSKTLQDACQSLQKATDLPIVTTLEDIPKEEGREFIFVTVDTEHQQKQANILSQTFRKHALRTTLAVLTTTPIHLLKRFWPILGLHALFSSRSYGTFALRAFYPSLIPEYLYVFHATYRPQQKAEPFVESPHDFIPSQKLKKFIFNQHHLLKKEEKTSLWLTKALDLTQTTLALALPYALPWLQFKVSCCLTPIANFMEYHYKRKKFYQLAHVATHETIQKAFRKGALHLHPDKNYGKNTTAIFQEFHQLYSFLKSAEQAESL